MKRTILIVGMLFVSIITKSQVTGFWEVTKVMVGDENLTPQMKWFHFKADSTFETGNGWLQNGDGKWWYDSAQNTLANKNTTGFADSFGPFNVEFASNQKMTWTRMEEGQKVVVSLERASSKNKTQTDLAVGLWDLETVSRDGENVLDEFDPENNRMVFLRWDHLVFDFINGQRVAGMWRIDAHRPALDILYYDTSKEPDYWQISFEGEDSMIWTKDDLRLTFSRLNSFPE